MEKTIYVNRPASRTWNRLGVNEAAVRWDTDAEALLSNERFTAVSGENAPLRIEAADGGAAYSRRVYTVTAEAGAELTVFEVCTAAQPLAAELRLMAAEGAHLRVVQLLNPTRGAVLRHELSAQLAENARLDLISLQLGDGAVYADHQISLAGDGAALRADLGYLARRSDTADIDLTVEQLGKGTVSERKRSSAAPSTSSAAPPARSAAKTRPSCSSARTRKTRLSLSSSAPRRTSRAATARPSASWTRTRSFTLPAAASTAPPPKPSSPAPPWSGSRAWRRTKPFPRAPSARSRRSCVRRRNANEHEL